ncbi:MAG: aspartate aminotransferase family protein [Planctomycetales bacterium]|nr:aspartate aminotransferase family protein [Planctomycetales bacterium]
MDSSSAPVPRPARLDEHQERVEGDTNQSPERSRYQTEMLNDATHAVLAEDAEYFLHQSLSTPCIDALVETEGVYLTDVAGRKIMDFHGNGVHHVGFRNPSVVQAVKDQLDVMPFCTRRYTNQQAVNLARKMREITPGKLDKVLFAPGGTSAIGMAMKLARLATGRYKTISMWGSFHGASIDVISVGGQSLFSDGLGPLLPGAIHVRPPMPEDCPFGCERVCNARCAEYIRHIMENERDVAAVIAEPIRWSTVTVPPPAYWQRVREICDQFGALLIFDEIGTALGRTGRMYAFEHFGVEPDIVVLGKGFGGGVMPLAGIVARRDLDIAGDRAIGHYTHEKNPVSCAAGLATINYIEQHQLVEQSRLLGEYTMERLRGLQEKLPCIREVRGAGLLIGVELQDHVNFGPAAALAEKAMYGAMARGLSFKVSSGNVLTLCPPLIITKEQLDEALGIIEASILDSRTV